MKEELKENLIGEQPKFETRIQLSELNVGSKEKEEHHIVDNGPISANEIDIANGIIMF